MENDVGEEHADLMNEEEIVEISEDSVNGEGGNYVTCEVNTDDSMNEEVVEEEEVATVEEELLPEKSVGNEKIVAKDLKAGKTCRLKTEGEKLSKIIRKTGKSKQKVVKKESAQLIENSEKKSTKEQPKEKQGKVKRDTRAQESSSKNRRQQKLNKKNVKNSKKKSSTGGKKNSKSQKSSKKNQQNKKTSRNEF